MSMLFVKITILLAASATACGLLRRRSSAATRHLVWTLTVVGFLTLPALSIVLPRWNVAIRLPTPIARDAAPIQPAQEPAPLTSVSVARNPSAAVSADVATADSTPHKRPAIAMPWATAPLGLYVLGVLLLLIQVARERATVQRITRHAAQVSDPEWQRLLSECSAGMGVHRPVRLLRSGEGVMPMAIGTRRPAILIPGVADTWSEDRCRAVLLHELAHVARHDCLTQTLAAIACAVYWIHPGVWWVARRLRVERELACDDRVLVVGTHARDYAGHLLELAYALGGQRAPALAVSMARPGQLEGRMLAVLDAARNRATPRLGSRVAAMAIAGALLFPMAGVHAKRASAPADGTVWPVTTAGSEPSAVTPSAVAQDRLPGTWEIRPSKTAGSVYLKLTDGNSSHGSTWPIDRLEGLLPAQLSGEGGLVHFSCRRDAGTFTFEGVFLSGVGAGTYRFSPSTPFAAELSKRGLGNPTVGDQYKLALGDIGFGFLDELPKQGYKRPDVSQLVRAADHGAQLDYLRGMGNLGYRLGSIDALIEQRDHGVTPEFIRGLAEVGLKGLSASELLRARDHGVSPQYLRELAQLGYAKLSIEAVIGARDHGISPDYVRDLKALGYNGLSVNDLVGLRDHGLTPDRIRLANSRAGTRLSIDRLKAAAAIGIK